MYERLIYELRRKPTNMCSDARLMWDASDVIERLDEIAQTYAETIHELEDKRKWIPVTERLPEKDTEVLAFVWGDRIIVGYIGNAWKSEGLEWNFEEFGLSGEDFDEVTHWMPLPEPPKECEP